METLKHLIISCCRFCTRKGSNRLPLPAWGWGWLRLALCTELIGVFITCTSA